MSAVTSSLGQAVSRRRTRVAYLALLRRSNEYALRSWSVRTGAVVIVAALGLSSTRWPAVLLMCAVPAIGCVLLLLNERHMARGTQPRGWLTRAYLRDNLRTSGRHRLSLGSYFDVSGSFLLIAAPSWVASDSPLVLRLGMLAAGTSFFISSALLIFNDHTWFNPEESSPPRWHEVARALAGPVVVGLTCAIALPADWGIRGQLAAVVICLTPVTVSFRIADTAVIMKYLAPLVRDESHAGRELVISETHGALSTNLRLLEQQARAVRDTSPALYELAVAANSRLRETLALARVEVTSADDASTIGAPVFTLARAVGARSSVEVTAKTLSPQDRDLVRLVLNDLVGNALNAGAGDVAVRVDERAGQAVVAVTDDAAPMPAGVWRAEGTSSARLGRRLDELGGGLSVSSAGEGKTVTACWDLHT